MSNPGDAKAAARKRLREQLRRMSADERTDASARICRNLMSQPFWRNAKSILAFVPTRTEPDIWEAVLDALTAGKRVHLLRYVPGTDGYEACAVRDPGTDLRPGPYGIPEPAAGCPAVDLKHLDLILVPGVGFSPSGIRLGRGKGYYDRLLAEAPACKCGVAFDQQVISELPTEQHDVRLDFLVTPSRGFAVSAPSPFKS